VDAHAVAEAMVRRLTMPDGADSARDAALRSLVLVSMQTFHGPAVGADEGETETGRDLA
jgi:hypothetical protein